MVLLAEKPSVLRCMGEISGDKALAVERLPAINSPEMIDIFLMILTVCSN